MAYCTRQKLWLPCFVSKRKRSDGEIFLNRFANYLTLIWFRYLNNIKTMKIVKDKIDLSVLESMSQKMFDNLVKAVVDIEKEIMVVDAPMHADEEAELLKDGSKQENVWGINLYPKESGDDFIEFDSMINIRPRQNNRSRGVENIEIQKKIINIVNKLVSR